MGDAKTPGAGRVGDEAVKKATGKTWDQWLSILDRAGARDMPHKQIALLLHEKHGVGRWWCQMVAVRYEQARGLRAKHERRDGFQISASKTVNAPLARLYEAWSSTRLRRRWIGDEELLVRKATPEKSMRITWSAGESPSDLSVNFYAKSDAKSQVSLNHGKLKSAAAGERMKRFWAARLEALREMLES